MDSLHARDSRLANFLPLLVVGLLALFPLVDSVFYMQLLTKVLIMAIFAMSLDLLVGYTGLVSFGHAAYFGLAGYALALMGPKYEAASLWWSLPAAMGACALFALFTGTLVLRTRGIFFIMVTLAFAQMLFFIFHDTKIGGGSDGMYIYFKPEVAIGGTVLLDLEDPRIFFWVVLALLASATALVGALVRAPFGRALAAARDNERRALSLGFPVLAIRLGAFVISALIAGVAGYFSAAQFGFVAPQMLGWHLSATVLVMVVLGGMSSVIGPIFGAFALIGLEEVLKSLFEHWKLVKGLIIIALVFLLPGGLQQLTTLVRPAASSPEPDATPALKEAANA